MPDDRRLLVAARWLTVAAIVWGALAFGAVYEWAYWPLAAVCLAAGVAGLRVNAPSHATPAILAMAFALLGVAVALQLIPLPVSVVAALSPNTMALLRAYRPDVAAGLVAHHPLSIDPASTMTALALLGSLAVLALGTARALAVAGPKRLVQAIVVAGVVLALVGVIQKPLHAGKIYGFWTPQMAGDGFGPFVNKNHFAGWMLMALPLTLALLCAGINSRLRRVRGDWRSRLLWLGSPDANRLILLAAAGILMALSLVLTMSRSGITALALSLVMTGWFVVRNRAGRPRKAIALAFLTLLVVVVVAWVGADAIVHRFASADWSEFNDRRGAWRDASDIGRAFLPAGTGLNTYSIATLFYQRHDLARHYAQAHNDYLQVFAEGGLLLAIPAALCVAALVAETWRRARNTEAGSTAYWLRAGAITAMVAVAFQESVDFSLQMPGNAALFAVVCGIAVHRAPKSGRNEHGRSSGARR